MTDSERQPLGAETTITLRHQSPKQCVQALALRVNAQAQKSATVHQVWPTQSTVEEQKGCDKYTTSSNKTGGHAGGTVPLQG